MSSYITEIEAYIEEQGISFASAFDRKVFFIEAEAILEEGGSLEEVGA